MKQYEDLKKIEEKSISFARYNNEFVITCHYQQICQHRIENEPAFFIVQISIAI